jgi:phage shock protein C
MAEKAHRLYRSRSDRMFAGVCGGLGAFFGIDPTIMRLLFVGLFLLGVPVIAIVYFVMMLIVPNEA